MRIEFHPGASNAVQFDADVLRQILGNLAGERGEVCGVGGLLSVSTAVRNGRAEIVVEDNGPGVPRDAREKIFLPFFRVSEALDSGAAGAGIGLTIARELARLHGGDLTLEESARGAKFQVVLAVDAAEEKKEST